MKNYIIINRIKEYDIEKVIYKIQELYGHTGYVEVVDVYKVKFEDVFILEFPNQPDFEHFKYFVNLAQYSGAIDYDIEAIGYWDLTTENPQNLKGITIMLFLAANDTEYDNIFGVTDTNMAYKLDFGNGIQQLPNSEKPFLEPKLEELNIRPINSIVSQKESESRIVEPKDLPKQGCMGILILPVAIAAALMKLFIR